MARQPRPQSRSGSHANGPRHVAPLRAGITCGAAARAPFWRARLATPRHRIDRAHTRADAPPVPAVTAHGRGLEGAGARLHACAEYPDTVGGQSTAHWAVWMCMGAVPMARGCWVQSRRSHQVVRRGRRGRWSSTRSDAGRAAAARQPGRQHRAQSGTRSAASAGCADNGMPAPARRAARPPCSRGAGSC